jgi:hypothetical protein
VTLSPLYKESLLMPEDWLASSLGRDFIGNYEDPLLMVAGSSNAQLRNLTLAKRATPGSFECKHQLNTAVQSLAKSVSSHFAQKKNLSTDHFGVFPGTDPFSTLGAHTVCTETSWSWSNAHFAPRLRMELLIKL